MLTGEMCRIHPSPSGHADLRYDPVILEGDYWLLPGATQPCDLRPVCSRWRRAPAWSSNSCTASRYPLSVRCFVQRSPTLVAPGIHVRIMLEKQLNDSDLSIR